jgi:HEPN domain-containing protein
MTAGDRIQAVILADFVAESVAKITGSALHVTTPKDAPLSRILGDLGAELAARGVALLYRGRVEHLRDVRNLVQHRGEVPTEASAQRAADTVEDFASELCRTVWGIDFSTVTRTQWIDDDELRRFMQHGERALQTGDRDQALAAIAHALVRLRALLRELPTWARTRWQHDLADIFRSISDSRAQSRARDLGETIDELIAEVEAVRAGLVGPDYEWLRRLIPEPAEFLDGHSSISFPAPGPSIDELQRAHELLMDWILGSHLVHAPPLPPQLDGREWHTVELPKGWPSGETTEL